MSITDRTTLIRKLGTACHVEVQALNLLRGLAADRLLSSEIRDRAELHATETQAQLRCLSSCLTTFGGPATPWADVASRMIAPTVSPAAWQALEQREIRMYQQLIACDTLADDQRFLNDCLSALDVQRSVLRWLDGICVRPARIAAPRTVVASADTAGANALA